MHLFKDKKDYQQSMSTNISYCFSENWPPADKGIIKQNIICLSYHFENFDLNSVVQIDYLSLYSYVNE